MTEEMKMREDEMKIREDGKHNHINDNLIGMSIN
jgi:hypothetical protein